MIPGVTIALRREPGNEDIAIPAYMTPGAAGADICAAVREAIVLPPGGRALIPSGFAFDVPDGFEVQIRPRSGLAIRHGIGLLNAPGTIDADYRGEVCCILINLGSEPYTVERGDRVAQMIVAPVVRAAFREVVELGPSGRGAGGFGSTGVRGT